jgi:hypothetical protein
VSAKLLFSVRRWPILRGFLAHPFRQVRTAAFALKTAGFDFSLVISAIVPFLRTNLISTLADAFDVNGEAQLLTPRNCISPFHTTNKESAIYDRSALSAPRCRAGCRAPWHLQILCVPPDSTYPSWC